MKLLVISTLAAATILSITCHCSSATDVASSSSNFTGQQRKFLSWLPESNEAITCYQNFIVPEIDNASSSDDPLRNWFAWAFMPITQVKAGAVYNLFVGRKIGVALESSGSFHPNADAAYRYSGCYIVKLNQPLEQKFFNELLNIGGLEKSVNGKKMILYSRQDGASTDSTCIYFPESDLVFIATDEKQMNLLLAGRADKLKKSKLTKGLNENAFIENFSEWPYVNRRSDIWALRHFAKETHDPQSPFSKGGLLADPSAIGVVLNYNIKGQDSLSISYLSASPGFPWPQLKNDNVISLFTRKNLAWVFKPNPDLPEGRMRLWMLGLSLIGHTVPI